MEFAYNRAPHKIAGMSPFRTVYRTDPLTLRDLVPRAIKRKPSKEGEKKVKEIPELHVNEKEKTERSNASCHSHTRKHIKKMMF